MPNFYCQWSEEIKDLTQEEQEWLKLALQYPYELNDEQFEEWAETLNIAIEKARLNEGPIDLEYWPGFDYSFCEEPDGTKYLWVHDSAGGGDIENVVLLVRTFLAKFRPGDVWTMNWGNTCSKPRIGAFGGGGVAVTAIGERWVSVSNELAKHTAELESITSKYKA